MVRVAEEDQAIVELSINSVVGLSNPGTMKVRGNIKGKEVVILIDCGANQQFYIRKAGEQTTNGYQGYFSLWSNPRIKNNNQRKGNM